MAAFNHILIEWGNVWIALLSINLALSGVSNLDNSIQISSWSSAYYNPWANIDLAAGNLPSSSSTLAAAIHPKEFLGSVWITDFNKSLAFLKSPISFSVN